jgi:hypothetical protein
MTDDVFSDALVDHAARNLTWDYAEGDRWSSWVDEVAGWYPDQDDRIAPLIEHSEADWYTVASEDMPGPGGYNHSPIPTDVVDGGELVVAVRADVEEGMASATKFRARVVSIVDGVPTTHVIDPAEPHSVFAVDPSAELWLVVAKIALLADFPMNYKVAFFPQPDFPEEEEEEEPHEDDTGEVPEDTGEAPDDTGEVPEEETTPPTAEDSDEPEESTDIDPPPAYDDGASETSKAGCGHVSQSRKSPAWLFLLLPALAIRRSRGASNHSTRRTP